MAARKIVFVNRFFFPDESATSQMLTDLAWRLAASGVRVHVLTSRLSHDDPKARLPARESIQGIEVRRLWSTTFGRSRLMGRAVDYATFYMSAAFTLLFELTGGDVVVAKTDPPLMSVVAGIAARLRGASLVNWLQDLFPEVASHLGKNPLPLGCDRLLRWLRDRSLRRARLNVVLGRRMAQFVAARGVRPERIQVIENWADTADVMPKPVSESALRERLGLGGKFVVGYSGNLGRAHDFGTLMEAAARLRDRVDIVFLVIGAGAQLRFLKDEVQRRKLPNVRFLPFQPRERLADSLASVDVHLASLVPALEGLIVPSKFYGILAAGRPTLFVGDSEGEIAVTVREQDIGLVVEPGDAAGMVRGIERLQRDEEARLAMGQRARALGENLFSADVAARRWMRLIGERFPDLMPRGGQQPIEVFPVVSPTVRA